MKLPGISAATTVQCWRSGNGARRSVASAVGLLLCCAGCAREAVLLAAAPRANLAQPLPIGEGRPRLPDRIEATRE